MLLLSSFLLITLQGSAKRPSPRTLVQVQTEQKTRAAFQVNFLLHPHESKVETMRRINEQVLLYMYLHMC